MQILLIILLLSCSPANQNSQVVYDTYEFAVFENKPVFEDEYLYDKIPKQCKVVKVSEIEIYLVDWNENNKFQDVEIDYIGIKSPLENRPTLVNLKDSIDLNINGMAHQIISKPDGIHVIKVEENTSEYISIITKMIPIRLTNGEEFLPQTTKDSTVFYFWATWCRPCIETLKKVDLVQLEEKGIDFIPIAYNCGNTKRFLDENGLNFKDLIISEESAKQYNIKALAKQYTFLKDGKVSGTNVELVKYYK